MTLLDFVATVNVTAIWSHSMFFQTGRYRYHYRCRSFHESNFFRIMSAKQKFDRKAQQGGF